MITRFTTETGSIYEVDEAVQKIRSVTRAKTVRLRDGNWCSYEWVSDIKEGVRVIILWVKTQVPLLEGSPPDASPSTITSCVVKVEQVGP